MAYAIPASDMLTICLILSGCDPDTSIAKVIEHVEDYQRTHECYFGVSDTDFGMALIWLAILREEIHRPDLEQVMSILSGIPLRQWVLPMLTYNDVYFNDEGESWDTETEVADCAERNRPLRQFFAQPANLNRDAIEVFFAEQGINADTIYEWTNGGRLSIENPKS